MRATIFSLVTLFSFLGSLAQNGSVNGKIIANNKPLEFTTVQLKGTNFGDQTDAKGKFEIKEVPYGSYAIELVILGYERFYKEVTISESNPNFTLDIKLEEAAELLGDFVISGTMKEVSKADSPVPVEVYSGEFFKANPTPSIFESLQNVNGVRPQLNCSVCNTGDVKINGLEGPYTMVLIDGMPIVSGLSTVYGLTGIPQSLIERIEIVKGPASTLYGSEAVGGLINIITKNPDKAPIFSTDVMGNSWGAINTDLGVKFNLGKKASSLLGINYFNYNNAIDNNNDNFTDVTLQNRISIFNKWNFKRANNRVFNIAGRYVYEDRWGGEMNWTPEFRGGDSLYGESIWTSRWELFGKYEIADNLNFQFSANSHQQNSVYGDVSYIAIQNIGFGQLVWNKEINPKNDLLIGASYRYTYYDDNTPATANFDTINATINQPSIITLPGLFVQDEIKFNENHKLLLGARYDYNSLHGSILSPRLNYKWSSTNKFNIVRVSFGNGYRVANVFTEDHAALTGARIVEFASELMPETSWNGNINYVKTMFIKNKHVLTIDATAFYTYFNNRIIADYDTDPNKIIYDNLSEHAISQGVSFNMDLTLENGFSMVAGATFMDVYSVENGNKIDQILTEKFAANWKLGYKIKKWNLKIDYTGNLYGPMRLPLLSDLDNRLEFSPWWSLQNIQLTKRFKAWELYGGVKNLLNYTPPANSIARAFDPFDREVTFDANGNAVATANNPNALTFDPTYVYAPNQGIRGFLGLRYTFN